MNPSSDTSRHYEVSFTLYRNIGIACMFVSGALGFFFFFIKDTQSPNAWIGACVLFAFEILGLYLFLSTSATLVFSEESVTHHTLFGVYRIRWEEVTSIEFDAQGTLVLHGEEKQFVVWPVELWSGKQKREACEFIQTKIEKLNITPKPGQWPIVINHKNVKVPKFEA
jgi:hypothetical protein